MDSYIIDLANIMLEMDDPELAKKNFMACTFALSVQRGIAPAELIGEMFKEVPDYNDWFENWLHFLQGLDSESPKKGE